MRLALVRHGQTAANVDRVLDTVLPGPGLTDLGRVQATALGAELAGGAEGPVVGLACSAARRARETAGLLGEALDLPVRVVEGVHEAQVGDLEGRNDEAAIDVFRDVFTRWQAGDAAVRFPGGESGAEVVDRFRGALDALRAGHAGDGLLVLVTHGAALRLVAEVLSGEAPPAGVDGVDNCGRVVLAGRDGGGWDLVEWRAAAPGAPRR